MKKILFICHRIPYPPNKGDKIRSYNFIRHLAESHEVHLAFMIDDPADVSQVDHLKAVTKNIFFATLIHRLKKLESLFAAMATGQPVSVPYFYSKSLQARIDDFLSHNGIDLVFCFSSPTAQYLYGSRHYDKLLKTIPKVMDFIDVDSHKWRQYAGASSLLMKWLYHREARLLLNYEKRIEQDFQQTLLVSEKEKELFESYVPGARTQVIGNGVDLDFFSPEAVFSKRLPGRTLVFTGAMDYRPNIEGAQWFVNKVLPLIQQRIGEVHFYLVGSNPSAEVKNLEETDWVHVTGFVQDIREYLFSAEICIVPLLIARGVQNKVLEAMAMGKAVICSPEAMEGIDALPGKDLLCARGEQEFADGVITLLSDEKRRKDLGRNARKCMEEAYSWGRCLSRLDSLVNDV